MLQWRPIGPGTWQPQREPTIDDLIREQQQDAAIAAAPAQVKTGSDPDPDGSEGAGTSGITYQRCGGGRRILRKQLGGV